MNTVMSQEINAFGALPLKRKAEIENKTEKSNQFYNIEFMGKYQEIKVIEVRIEFPIYRLANGRTRSFQREYLALHNDCPSDLFTRDENSVEAQLAQHQILLGLAEEENLFRTFSDKDTAQTDPLICTYDGVIVNGNRRLCTWRELYYRDKEKYKRFQTVRIAVLPECDLAAIEDLESRLQLQKPMIAEYHWHTIALMAKEKVENGVKENDVAKSYDLSVQNLKLLMDACDYAAVYLERIGKENQWSLVNEDQFAFEAMVKARKKLTSQGDKELFESICFICITEGSRGGRLYKVIPDIADNIQQIAQKLQTVLNFTMPENVTTGTNTSEKPSDLDILRGNEAVNVEDTSILAIAVENNNEPGLIQDTALEVIDTQKQLQKEKKSKNYLLDQLSKAVSALQNAIGALEDDANRNGLEEQLDSIEEKVEVVRRWLEKK